MSALPPLASSDASIATRGSATIAPLPLYRRLIGKAMAWGYRLTGKHRYDNFRLERVQDMPIIVTPSVFNPKIPRTGEFLASELHPGTVRADWDVLDLGTGSGVCALFAARHARRVVAVDINAAAIRCATINAQLNHLEHKIELRHGDLFAPVYNERFDLVLFNPPFIAGSARDDRDRAWRSSDIAGRFASGLAGHLKPGGSALLLLSTFGDASLFLWELRRHELTIAVQAERRFINEQLTIFRIKRPA
jgi:methylase of polypeptide subunit release factors